MTFALTGLSGQGKSLSARFDAMEVIMTTLQMRYFLETARQLNFSATAERFYITQSTLSRQIKSIEDELGVRLFVRSNNTVWLTQAGRQLYEGLLPICSAYESLCTTVKDADLGFLGELRIAIPDDQLFNPSLCSTIRAFREKYPRIAINIEKADFRYIHDELRNGTIDIAVSFWHNEGYSDSIGCIEIASERTFLAVPKEFGHPLLDDLREQDIYLISRDLPLCTLSPDCFGLHAYINEHLNCLPEDKMPMIHYIPSLSALPQYVTLGLGMTIVNETHVLSLDPSVKLCPFTNMEPIHKVLCYNCRSKNDVSGKFIELFEEHQNR